MATAVFDTAAPVVGGARRRMYSQVAEYTAAVFEQGAKSGDPEALWSYAMCLRVGGKHTNGNAEAAHEWFMRAVPALIPLANAGDAKAQYRVGICYKNGYGCEAAPAVAKQWFATAAPGLKALAEAGDAKAANYYAVVLTIPYGGGLQWKDETVLRWRKESARLGHAPAHVSLAICASRIDDMDATAFHCLEIMRGGMRYGFEAAKKDQALAQAIERIKATEVTEGAREQLGAWVAVATGLPGEASAIPVAPRSGWVADTMSKNCCQCSAAFGIMKRRHHCRACGNLICSRCTATHVAVGKVCTLCNQILIQYRRVQDRSAGTAAAAAAAAAPVHQSLPPPGCGFCVVCGKLKQAGACQHCDAPAPELPVLVSGDVTVGRELGSGNFGTVHEGVCRLAGDSTASITCAVKIPNKDAMEDFQQELDIYKRLASLGSHPHLVTALGYTVSRPQLLALEYCALGDLRSLLHATKESPPVQSELVRFGCEVATAMAFLEAHGLLHRDLAARNVLLTAPDRSCRLADFGLSRDAGVKDYYRRNAASAPIPVRWMAIETLEMDVSTIRSESWSFGVLLYEIFSLGRRPYTGLSNNEIFDHIDEGHRLKKPSKCPSAIYKMMKQCWQREPEARPTFASIVETLAAVK